LLNAIFGIIIDKFTELREIKNNKSKEIQSRCFICDIEKEKFEQKGISFNEHNEVNHN
jgi:hypothetical protein